ncbi:MULTISPECIES: hypothetical protein [Vibrio]|uniref:hypothetical protein n=1 Tax=Vibrio TaxID=662 RepID=UPI000313880B|nr:MULTISPECIES: hypothetical protein [Vibrio]OCH55332.1 hypothetical protein A6E08_04295 [Vibrio lentus]
MNTIDNKKLLQALALFSFAYKGNTDNLDFEGTDAGIEIENLAFTVAEDMNFDIEAHMSYLSRATVLERCRLMIEQLVKLLNSEVESKEPLYIAIIDCPEFNTPEYLFNQEERLEELNIKLWTDSNVSMLEEEHSPKVKGLELFDGLIANEHQSFSVFRVK